MNNKEKVPLGLCIDCYNFIYDKVYILELDTGVCCCENCFPRVKKYMTEEQLEKVEVEVDEQ
jgi:hypothetical protein